MKNFQFAPTAVSIWLSGLGALLLGCCVLAGWAFLNPALIRIVPEWDYMVINTALCLSVSGISLLLVPLRHWKLAPALRNSCLVLVLLLSAILLLQIVFDLDLGVDLVEYQRRLLPGRPYPGRITPIGTVGFLLFSLASLIHIHAHGPRAVQLVRWLTLILFMIGLSGMVAKMLDLENLYPDFYPYTGLAGMAFHTSFGLLVLGVGLWGLWYHTLLRNKKGVAEADQDVEVRDIYYSTAAVICALGLATGVTAFALLQSTVKEEASASLLQLLKERRNFFDTVLEFRTQRAAVASDQPVFAEAIKTLRVRPNDVTTLRRLQEAASKLESFEFSGVAIAIQGQAMDTTLFGRLHSSGNFSVPLKGRFVSSLLWHDGHFLQVRYPLIDRSTGEILGSLITEQPLPKLDHSQSDTATWGKTGDLVVCAHASDGSSLCLPHRGAMQTKRFMVKNEAAPLPMTRALRKETGSGVEFDYFGRRVIAAYGPVGSTGLGMVVKMQVAEIYAPIRNRLESVFPAIAILMLLGLWLIYVRVRPLVQKLAVIRTAALRERTNFIAAAESAPDAFFILESILGPDGGIADFKFVYLNHQVKRVFPKVNEDAVGCSFLETFPQYQNYFEKYRQVALSGTMLEEEIDWQQRDQKTKWTNLQVVQMPNGVAVTWRDITNRKNSERLLSESNRLRSAIVDNAPYSIVSTDSNGVILTFNLASEQMLGYSVEEVVGKVSPRQFHDPADFAVHAAALSEELGEAVEPNFDVIILKAVRGFIDEREWTWIRKDGSRLPVRLSMVAIRDEQNHVTGFLSLAQDITEQKRVAEQTRHTALHDVLTGLPNRALLTDRMAMAIKQSQRTGLPFALALLDIDRFKYINDSLGHPVGDQVLIEFVRRVSSCLRPADTFARMGGDEFVLLLADCTNEVLPQILERIFEALRAPMKIEESDLHITSSIGISLHPAHGHDMATLMRRADTALYWVKERGRNNYRIFSSEIDQGKEDRLRLESELHEAVERGDFCLCYQPVVNLRQRKVVGVEALLRWRQADGSSVPPTSFIPISEDNGLIVKIGAWVLNQACQDAVRLQQQLQTPLKMSVNISPRQFMHDDLAGLVRTILTQTQLAPDLLELEMTEGILMNQQINAAEQLHAIHALGVTIVVDDFGTGYTSLSYLRRFPIGKIKIDHSFVHDVMSDPEDAALTGAIISMGHSLNIPIVAVGIETRDQFDFLMRHWCEMGQGYFFAPPMTLDDFVSWYRKHDFRLEVEDLEFVVLDHAA